MGYLFAFGAGVLLGCVGTIMVLLVIVTHKISYL